MLTVDDLRARAVRKAADFCWHWGGCSRIYTYCHDSGTKRVMTIPQAVWNIAHGEGPGRMIPYRICATRDCVCPAHYRLARSHAEMMDVIKRTGRWIGKSVESKLDNLRHAWAKNGNITPDELVRKIRAEPPHRTSVQISAEIGVSVSCVSRIRRGESRAGVAGPEEIAS